MNKDLQLLTPGLMPYREAWELQKKVHAERLAGNCPDTLILLEHPPVYTLGRHAVEGNITADQAFLEAKGIEIVQSDRGGDVTYHGPGQLVGYPIFRLPEGSFAVKEFVRRIERTLIRCLEDHGICSTTHDAYPGVWVGRNKIAAIGLRIIEAVSMHGFALNVSPDLSHYTGIIACGIQERGITTMEGELRRPVSMEEVQRNVAELFKKEFS